MKITINTRLTLVEKCCVEMYGIFCYKKSLQKCLSRSHNPIC